MSTKNNTVYYNHLYTMVSEPLSLDPHIVPFSCYLRTLPLTTAAFGLFLRDQGIYLFSDNICVCS